MMLQKTKNTSLSRSPMNTFNKNHNLNNLFTNTRNATQGSCSQYAQRMLRSSGKVNNNDIRFELNELDRRTLTQHQRKIADARCSQYDQTPTQKSIYRSMGRISKLLQTQEKCKNEDDVYNLLKKGAGRGQNRSAVKDKSQCSAVKDKSQCSSATTAFTIAQFGNQGIQTRGRKKHQDEPNSKLIGRKRTARRPIEYLEKESRIHTSMSKSQATFNDSYSTPSKQNFSSSIDICSPGSIINIKEFGYTSPQRQEKRVARNEKPEIPEQRIRKKFTIVRLKNKKTNQREEYKLYDNVDLSFLRAKIEENSKLILDFNMEKLELEYDYDTDEDQLRAAREMLMHENISAVEFIIKEDPILLVGNLCPNYD